MINEISDLSDDALVSAKDLAALGLAHRVTLCRWRERREGPPFIRLSPGRVAYRMGDVRKWLAARTTQTAA
jgi:predicted DNA-binding transcriptional regulator AlpA